MLAVFIVGGLQVAHWDPAPNPVHACTRVAQGNDGLCPICYSVPVGHGAAPVAIDPVCLHEMIADAPTAPTATGIEPEFRLQIRPPPSLA